MSARDQLRRAAEGVGVLPVRQLATRVDELAVAVDENHRLGALLDRQVADLERSLVPLLEQRHRRSTDA